MAAIRCSPRACCGKRLIVAGLVMCTSYSYTCLSVIGSRFNECWDTLHVSYSASCLGLSRGEETFDFGKFYGFTHDHPWCKYPFSTAPCQLNPSIRFSEVA